jgi:hypothetical protein
MKQDILEVQEKEIEYSRESDPHPSLRSLIVQEKTFALVITLPEAIIFMSLPNILLLSFT